MSEVPPVGCAWEEGELVRVKYVGVGWGWVLFDNLPDRSWSYRATRFLTKYSTSHTLKCDDQLGDGDSPGAALGRKEVISFAMFNPIRGMDGQCDALFLDPMIQVPLFSLLDALLSRFLLNLIASHKDCFMKQQQASEATRTG